MLSIKETLSITYMESKLPEKPKKEKYTTGELFRMCLDKKLIELKYESEKR